MTASEVLKRYFLDELKALRRDSARFATDYPTAAAELGLAAERAKDPDVELLLQSFAFVAGQLRYAMDVEDSTLPAQLVEALQPELASPLPAMAVLELDVKPSDANFAAPQILPARSEFSETRSNRYGLPCRFTTAEPAAFLPVEVVQVEPLAVNAVPREYVPRGAVSGVKVRVRSLGPSLSQLALPSLRFFLGGAEPYRLYDCLARSVVAVVAGDPRRGRMVTLEAPGVRLDVLPLPSTPAQSPSARSGPGPQGHPGLALLRSYFAFPERHLFVSVDAPPTRECARELELWIWLSEPCPPLSGQDFRLNCVPIENLFRQRLEPFPLQPGCVEYRLVGDRAEHQACEIHSLKSLDLITQDGAQFTPLALYTEAASVPRGAASARGVFYTLRREPSQYPSVAGTETFLTFVNGESMPAEPSATTAGGLAWCTNRRAPERLGSGDRLLGAPGLPVQGGKLVSHPSRHGTPRLLDQPVRRLCAQLGHHSLPLWGGREALERFKRMLGEHFEPDNARARQQVDGLRAVRHARVAERTGREAWHGLTTGIELTFTLDVAAYTETSALLFGESMSNCLADFAPLNSFVRVRLEDLAGATVRELPLKVRGAWEGATP